MDYNIYTNAQVADAAALNDIPLKTEGQKSVFISDVGKAVDGAALQYNIVRVNGQKSVYVADPEAGRRHQHDCRRQRNQEGHSVTCATFPRSSKRTSSSINPSSSSRPFPPCLREGGIGLLLTAVMILVFLGSFRAPLPPCFFPFRFR